MANSYSKVKGKLVEEITKTRKCAYTLSHINEQIAKWQALKTQAEAAGVTE